MWLWEWLIYLKNTHFGYDILTVTVRENSLLEGVWDRWQPGVEWRPLKGFLTLRAPENATVLEKKLLDMMAAQYGQDFADRYTYHLQPIERVHLYSNTDYGFRGFGDVGYVYGIDLLNGTNTLRPIQNREDRTFLINEALARAFGEGSPIGKRALNPYAYCETIDG
jgi:hypothetical protein